MANQGNVEPTAGDFNTLVQRIGSALSEYLAVNDDQDPDHNIPTLSAWLAGAETVTSTHNMDIVGEEEPTFDASTYLVRDGEFLLHVALRRKQFLPGATDDGWVADVYDFINKNVVGANSPTIHHYELVCWFTHHGGENFFAGCLQLSFDWLEKSYLGDSVIDSLITLFKDRPARLTKGNWFPNRDPGEGDDGYRYMYVGNRLVNHQDVFLPFVDTTTHCFNSGVDLKDPFWEKHYNLRKTCCFSFALKVLSKFLAREFDHSVVGSSPWKDYASFYQDVIHAYPKPSHCECVVACRCIPNGRSQCRCIPNCTCPLR